MKPWTIPTDLRRELWVMPIDEHSRLCLPRDAVALRLSSRWDCTDLTLDVDEADIRQGLRIVLPAVSSWELVYGPSVLGLPGTDESLGAVASRIVGAWPGHIGAWMDATWPARARRSA